MGMYVPFEELFAQPTRNGLTKPKRIRGFGAKFVNMGEIFAYSRMNNVSTDRVPLSESERSTSLLEAGDLLFARQSLVLSGAGKCSIFIEDNEDVAFESHIIRVRLNKQAADPLFYYYYFQSHSGRSTIESIVEQGAGASGIRGSDLSKLNVPLPPLSEQKAIAHILGSLDDKIELNRKMNETLEAMARAIFKSWFVDFDPVRAKAEGRKPDGMDEETAKLFPDSFEDSELGLIPKGWRVDSFGNHVSVERGLSYKGEGLCEEGQGIPMHNLNSIYEGGRYKHEGIKYYKGEYKERHIARSGDLIATNTEQGFDRLLIGYSAMIPPTYGMNGIYSHHIYRIRINNHSPLTPIYLQNLINSKRWHDWISGFSNGTTINMLPQDAFSLPLLAVPPHSLVLTYDQFATNYAEMEEANRIQAIALSKTRDSLLPKLLSGQIRIRDAEKFVAGVL
ncbi:MAG: restriction endonuclease subunit S [Spartobacteria bacterium]|nr:restriction endonuclease subunit S [Spartobacteria bacterium]